MDQLRELFVVKQKQTKTLDHPIFEPSAHLTEKRLIRVALDGERLIVTIGDTACAAGAASCGTIFLWQGF